MASTDGIPAQIRRALGQADGEGRRAGQSAGRSFGSAFTSSMKGLAGAVGVTAGVAGVAAAMKSAITSGMDFTSALNTMQAVSGATSQQLAAVSAEARKLGTDNSLSATSSVDAANAMLELAKGGFTVEQSMAAARGTLQLAAAAQIDAAQAATIQSQALQAFGKSADYAGKAADILANSANASSAEITDVAYALQASGTVANQFGLTMSDTAATISLLANAGIKGSDAGTLLKSALLALTDQGKPAQAAIKELGLTVYDANGKFVGMESMFGQLQAASKRMTAEQYQAATATLFGSDAMRLSGIAAQQGAGGFNAMRAAMERNGSAAEVAAAKMQGLPGAWERLKNAAQDAGLAFYDVVKGPLTTAANAASDAIGQMVSKAQSAGDRMGEAFNQPGLRDTLRKLATDTGSTFSGLRDAAVGLIQPLASVSGSLAKASAALGFSGWQIMLTTLQAATTVLNALNPLLATTAGLMQSHQGIVTAAVAGWLLFKTVPALMGRVTGSVAALGTTTTTTTSRMMALVTANNAVVQAGRFGAVQMGRFGSQIAMIGQRVPIIAQMQTSFLTAASSATQFGRTAGTLSAALTGLRQAGSNVAGVFGGPWGLAITAAIAYLGLAASAHADNTQKARAQSKAVQDLAQSEVELGAALQQSRGNMTDDTWAKAGEQLSAYRQTLVATADTHKSTWEQTKELGGLFKLAMHTNDGQNQAANQAMAANKAISELKLTNDQLARSVYGSDSQFGSLAMRLSQTGEGGAKAAGDLKKLRDAYQQQRDLAARVTPGVTELGEAMRIMGDKSATAADKSNALKAALDALNPARTKGDAIARHNETLQRIAESTQQAIDKTKGFGVALLDAQLGINTSTENGQNLRKSLMELVDATQEAAAKGADMGERNRLNQQALVQLATQYGLTAEQIRAAAAKLGLDDVEIVVALKGAPEVIQQLAAISQVWNETPDKREITVEESQVSRETRAQLERFGVKVSQPVNGMVTITANDDAARAKLLLITQNVNVLNALKANPNIDLNTTQFNAGNAQVRAELQGLDKTAVSPEAALVIDKLLQGKQVSIQELETLSKKTANPKVDMAIQAIMQKIQLVNNALDNAAKPRYAEIVAINGANAVGQARDSSGRRQPGGRADGAIVRYAAGGISDLEAYANGAGLRFMQKPTRADIYAGRGDGTVFAEESTGGEAYIPLATGKRGRSTDILAAVASMFGYQLLPQGALPDTLSGLIGGVAGGALSKLLKASKIDGVRRFADGGIVTGAQLRALAEGQGASRPLTGAPYVRGGVNWGDCTGAQSAFARLAAGLPPFGGRFSTANMGDYLAKLGAKSGTKTGAMNFGWYHRGGEDGHAAGTLPDGANVEMGGGNGGGMLGGSVGANDSQFTNRAYIDVKDEDRYNGGGNNDSPAGGNNSQNNPDAAYGGGYNFDPISQDSNSSGDTSISGRVGSAVGAFITGQLSDVFSVLSLNDQPGWLAAITEYERKHSEDAKKNYDAEKKKLDEDFKAAEQQRKADYDAAKSAIDRDYQSQLISSAEKDNRLLALKNQYESDELGHRHDYENAVIRTGQKYGQVNQDSVSSLSGKQRYENEQLKRSQGLQADQFAREVQFEREKRSLESLRDAKSISPDEYQRRLGALQSRYDADIRGMRTRYNNDDAVAKAEYDRSQAIYSPQDRYNPSTVTTEQYHPNDPGTNSAGRRGDPDGGGRTANLTGNSIKDAFKSGLREAWQQGQPWTDTDWIITKESNWNPTAVNPSSGAFGLPQFLGATKDKYLPDSSPDPKVQGTAYDHYVGDRYQTPMGARAHWEANNWYDSGGVGVGTGLMAKNVLTPERVLSPRQTEAFEQMVRSNFQGAGSDQIVAKLDQLMQVLARLPRGATYNVGDDRNVERAQKIEKSRQRAAMAGW
ncbi:phage tail tape measure protein [Gordonia sp. ABSL49_1]|uniref:phage tail tape measure protein n=1 Tax=Gordonia sp. ABSL49_1 TaxID=2920941 RepID=UPI001F0F8612|nr:phage tail tape measure protein [Gordonia sp. ABSL49_1]MCH5645169.1 phage tail tape measure protein [Gordonia sp. ABSL49_1]